MNDPDKDEKQIMVELELKLRECVKNFLGILSDEEICSIFLQTAMSAVFFSIEDPKEAMEFIQNCLNSSRERTEILKEVWGKCEKKMNELVEELRNPNE